MDQFKGPFLALLLVAVLDGVAMFAVPAVLAEFTKGSIEIILVKKLLALLGFLYLFSLCLAWITRKYGETLSQEFEQHLRFKLYQRYVGLPYLSLKDQHSGYFLSLSGKIAAAYKVFINAVLWTFARGVTMIVFFLAIMARESFVSAVLNSLVLLIFTLFSIYFAVRISKEQKELSRRYSGMIQVFADFLTNVSTVKQLGVYSFAENKILAVRDFANQQVKNVQNAHAWKWFFLHGLYGLAFIGTIVYLLWLISQGRLSSAILVVMVGGFMTLRGTLSFISEIVVNSLELKVNLENLSEVIGLDSVNYSRGAGATDSQVLGFSSIETRQVTFKYSGSARIIRYPDIKIKKGDVLCITGESGKGKTSFLNILQGNLAPLTGQLLIDDRAVNHEELQGLSKYFIHISQEVELFNLSLYDNLCMGVNLPQEFLKDELRKVNMFEWFEQLEDGFSTVLGEKGTKLSAGQKQRINLVRGLLQERPIVLLDEPTSHMDIQTEEMVVEYLKEKLVSKTAVIVTHRESLLKLGARVVAFS